MVGGGAGETETGDIAFDAFVSYRHVDPDRQIGEALHRQLESYRLPRALVRAGYAGRLRRVFRDREEMAATADLKADLRDALRASRYLVVLCSKSTSSSRWIDEEVAEFLRLGRGSQILCVLIDGELRETLPPSLRYLPEPLAIDVRAPTLRTTLRRLRAERLRLVAAILGCRYDDLKQRDSERARRRARWMVLAMTILMGAGVSLGAELVKERNAARQERRSARILDLCQRSVNGSRKREYAAAARDALEAWEASQLYGGLHWAGIDAAMRELLSATVPHRPFPIPQGSTMISGHSSGRVAVVLENGTLLVRDVAGLPERRLSGEGEWVTALAWSEDGEELAAGRTDGSVQVFGAVDAAPKFQLPAGKYGPVSALAVHRDRNLVAIAAPTADGSGTGVLELFSTADPNSPQWHLEDQRGIRSLAFSLDGDRLASAAGDRTIRVCRWSANGVRQILLGKQEASVRDLGADPHGGRLVSCDEGGRVRVWQTDAPEGPPRTIVVSEERFQSVSLQPEGDRVAAGGYQNRVYVWNLGAEGNVPQILDAHRFSIQVVDFVGDSMLLTWDGEADPLIWRIDTSAQPREIRIDSRFRVERLAFAPDSHSLVCCAGNEAYLANLEARDSRVIGFRRPFIAAVAFDETGSTLALGRIDGIVELWRKEPIALGDSVTLDLEDISFLQVENAGTRGSAWSESGRRGDWPTEPGRIAEPPAQGLHLLAANGEGDFAGVDSERRIVRWRADGQREVVVVGQNLGAGQRIHSGAFTPDGSKLALGGLRPSLLVVDFTAPEPEFHVPPGREEIFSLAVSADGEFVAIGGRERQLQLRRLQDLGAPAINLIPPEGGAYDWIGHNSTKGIQDAIAFSPDGRQVAAAFGGGHVLVWPTTRSLVEQLEWMTQKRKSP